MITFKKIELNFIIKRKIGLLAEVIERMTSNKILQEARKSVKNENYMEKVNKLKEKVKIKVNSEKYETIQENFNEKYKKWKARDY